MILEIGSHFGVCQLSGPGLSQAALKARFFQAQRESGGNRDSFLEVLLDGFHWKTAPLNGRPAYCFDLDIGERFAVKY